MSAAAAVDSTTRGDIQFDKDYNHVSDKEYIKFRKLAQESYDKRNQLSQLSQKAYKSGNKQEAHALSVKAKNELEIAEGYNNKAAEYVFIENNRDSDSNDIDLHGLYVKEAEYILKQRIISGIKRQQPTLDCIVGKGLHSKNGIAKLKPAIENLCKDANLKCWLDKKNSGVLHIDIQNAQIPQTWYYSVDPNGVGAMDGAYQPQGQPNYSANQGIFQPQQQQQNNYHQQQNYNNNNGNGNGTAGCNGILLALCGTLLKSLLR